MSSLSSGRSTSCTNGLCSGGIASSLYLANANQVTSVQQSSANDVTGITMTSTAAVFYTYDFRGNSAQFSETVTVDDTTRNVSVEQTFEMIWDCRNLTDRNLIADMANNACGMVAIHQEQTGTYWIWGYKGVGGGNTARHVFLQTAEGLSGAALSDPNQTTLTLRCVTTEPAVTWTAASSAIPT